MELQEIRDHGHHLAIVSSIRVLAECIAQLTNPSDPDAAFIELGQMVFQHVDGTTNSSFSERDLKAIKEATYDSLRAVFEV
jgi:hypothetical protein